MCVCGTGLLFVRALSLCDPSSCCERASSCPAPTPHRCQRARCWCLCMRLHCSAHCSCVFAVQIDRVIEASSGRSTLLLLTWAGGAADTIPRIMLLKPASCVCDHKPRSVTAVALGDSARVVLLANQPFVRGMTSARYDQLLAPMSCNPVCRFGRNMLRCGNMLVGETRESRVVDEAQLRQTWTARDRRSC